MNIFRGLIALGKRKNIIYKGATGIPLQGFGEVFAIKLNAPNADNVSEYTFVRRYPILRSEYTPKYTPESYKIDEQTTYKYINMGNDFEDVYIPYFTPFGSSAVEQHTYS